MAQSSFQDPAGRSGLTIKSTISQDYSFGRKAEEANHLAFFGDRFGIQPGSSPRKGPEPVNRPQRLVPVAPRRGGVLPPNRLPPPPPGILRSRAIDSRYGPPPPPPPPRNVRRRVPPPPPPLKRDPTPPGGRRLKSETPPPLVSPVAMSRPLPRHGTQQFSEVPAQGPNLKAPSPLPRLLLSVEEPESGDRELCGSIRLEAVKEVDGLITPNEPSAKRKRRKRSVGSSTDDNPGESVGGNTTVGDSSSSHSSSND
jgi:hypothetical protein